MNLNDLHPQLHDFPQTIEEIYAYWTNLYPHENYEILSPTLLRLNSQTEGVTACLVYWAVYNDAYQAWTNTHNPHPCLAPGQCEHHQ